MINRQTDFEDLPQMMTPQEVQAFFGLGRATVYSLIKEGEIPVRRIGRRLFVPKQELVEGVAVA